MTSSWHSILKQAGPDYSFDSYERASVDPAPARVAGDRRSLQQARVLQAVHGDRPGHATFAVIGGGSQLQPPAASLPKGSSWRSIAAISFSGAIIGLSGYALLGRGDAGERVSQQAVEFAKAIDDVKDRIKPVLASIDVAAPAAPRLAPGQRESLALPNSGAASAVSRLHKATEDAFFDRASKQLKLGDVAGARKLYETLVQFGSERAAMALAETYDPFVLAWSQADIRQSDAKQARQWYEKAAGLGSADARHRLDELEQAE
jgi:hypothetical protein